MSHGHFAVGEDNGSVFGLRDGQSKLRALLRQMWKGDIRGSQEGSDEGSAAIWRLICPQEGFGIQFPDGVVQVVRKAH
jgi:hypothetical protein